MEKVVSASQHAFVESKQIIVVFFIANEPINTRLKSSKSEILCKLDMKKACDHLNQSFLLLVFGKIGLGLKWIRQIKWCNFMKHSSIFVHGNPTSFFQCTRDLRQGDPLSPYLFIMVMEMLSHILNRAIERGFLVDISVCGRRCEGMELSYLLFVDDTLILCNASKQHMKHLSW